MFKHVERVFALAASAPIPRANVLCINVTRTVCKQLHTVYTCLSSHLSKPCSAAEAQVHYYY